MESSSRAGGAEPLGQGALCPGEGKAQRPRRAGWSHPHEGAPARLLGGNGSRRFKRKSNLVIR